MSGWGLGAHTACVEARARPEHDVVLHLQQIVLNLESTSRIGVS